MPKCFMTAFKPQDVLNYQTDFNASVFLILPEAVIGSLAYIMTATWLTVTVRHRCIICILILQKLKGTKCMSENQLDRI